MPDDSRIKFNAPRQDLAALSAFEPNAMAAREWALHLPVANTVAAAQQILEAITDLNRFELKPEIRFSILEALAPNLNIALGSLARRFINQPLVMPEQPRQMAELTDALFSATVTAYTLVAIEGLQQRSSIREMNPAKLVCESIHRALHFSGLRILQSFQLYQPVELKGWLSLHQLYSLAERQGVEKIQIEDTQGNSSSIANTYLQAILLGCCKPNQLRQSDLAAVYFALHCWSEYLTITATDEGLFIVDLNSDQPPLYSALFGGKANAQCRYIDTSALVSLLSELRTKDDAQGKPGLTLNNGTNLPSNMLPHLIDSLGSMSMRNFARVSSFGPLTVSLGLSGAHFQAAGQCSFEQLIHGDDYVPETTAHGSANPFLKSDDHERDVWSEANPEEDFIREDAGTEEEEQLAHIVEVDQASMAAIEPTAEPRPAPSLENRFPLYQVNMLNASPGGYCLDWSTDLPSHVKTGDIISVQEEKDGDWSIAVIRWVSALEESRTLIGVELLSPKAVAYGAQIQHKTGEKSAPQRVLLLPEIALVGQSHTLITPRASFRERQKITLIHKHERFHIQLQRQIAATGSYAQFDFRYLKQLGDLASQDTTGSMDVAYDSLWSNI